MVASRTRQFLRFGLAACVLRGLLGPVVGLAFLTTFLAGCATVGPAVPQLSARVGDRLAEMRSLHEHAIRRLFDGERQRVDAFIDERWAPEFLRNYVGVTDIVATVSSRKTISVDREASVAGALRSYLTDSSEAPRAARVVIAAIERERVAEPTAIRRELARFVGDDRVDAATVHVAALLGSEDPAHELIEWARYAEREIQRQRAAMHAPIDEAEERTLTELGSAYDDLIAMQSAVTARVQAAAKLKELQDDALRGMGVQAGFERAKQRALAVGGGVSRALEQLDRLDHSSLLKGTKAAEILRDALAPATGAADSTAAGH